MLPQENNIIYLYIYKGKKYSLNFKYYAYYRTQNISLFFLYFYPSLSWYSYIKCHGWIMYGGTYLYLKVRLGLIRLGLVRLGPIIRLLMLSFFEYFVLSQNFCFLHSASTFSQEIHR